MADVKVVRIDNVRVLRDEGLSLSCDFDGRIVEVPKLMLQGPTPLPGTTGPLYLREWFAIDKGLVPKI